MDKRRFVHFGAEMAEKCQLKIEMYKTWKMGRTFRGRSGIYLAESGVRAIHEVRALCYHGSGTFEKGSARVYGNVHRPLSVAEGFLREGARAVRVRERRAGRHQGQRPRRAHEDARAVRRERGVVDHREGGARRRRSRREAGEDHRRPAGAGLPPSQARAQAQAFERILEI